MWGVTRALVAMGLAMIAAIWAGLVSYGDNVFAAYTHDKCHSKFYDDVQVIRETSLGLFVGSIWFLLAASIGIWHNIWANSEISTWLTLIGYLGIVIAGAFAFLVGLTGYCEYEVGSEYNGEVWDLDVFATLVLVLGVVQAMLLDVRIRNEKGLYTVASLNPSQSFVFGARTATAAFIAKIMWSSSAHFAAHYVDTDHSVTLHCAYAATNQTSLDSDAYENIRLGHYSSSKWHFNPYMVNLSYCVVAFLCTEFVAKTIELAHAKGNLLWIPGAPEDDGVSMWKITGCVSQRITDIFIAIFAYSLLIANSLAGCPTYDGGNGDMQGLYISLVVLYILSTLCIFDAVTHFSPTFSWAVVLQWEFRHPKKDTSYSMVSQSSDDII